MPTVDTPMVSSAATSVALRPMRSPKCPKTAEPMGRARKASAKVARDCNDAVFLSTVGKYSLGKTSTAAVA